MSTNDRHAQKNLNEDTTVASVGGDDASLTGEPHGGSSKKKLPYKKENEKTSINKIMRFKEWIELGKS